VRPEGFTTHPQLSKYFQQSKERHFLIKIPVIIVPNFEIGVNQCVPCDMMLSYHSKRCGKLITCGPRASSWVWKMWSDLRCIFCRSLLGTAGPLRRRKYSQFRGRWDSKWWSEWKLKSQSESWNYCSRSLLTWKFEKSHKTVVSWFRWWFRFAFRLPFRVSSSTKRAVTGRKDMQVPHKSAQPQITLLRIFCCLLDWFPENMQFCRVDQSVMHVDTSLLGYCGQFRRFLWRILLHVYWRKHE